MAAVALSRTCDLRDFAQAHSVADWQQAHAREVWEAWISAYRIRTRDGATVVNYSGCPFEAPGPTAIYRYPGQDDNGQEERVSAVFALSVLDHIPAPLKFISQAQQRLRKHGLFYASFAYWAASGTDLALGHEGRTRIYDAGSLKKLVRETRQVGFNVFGAIDWRYNGDVLVDHSLFSIVLVRR